MRIANGALAIFVLVLLAGCDNQDGIINPIVPIQPDPEPPGAGVKATEVRDLAALERLRGNAGITLQWIHWQKRGLLEVTQRGAVVHLKGLQVAPDGKGLLDLDGDVLSIDTDQFIFRGRITISDTPDPGRSCFKNGDSVFAITQQRKYWRMREFEWCDSLTDYIDIYF
ncbi:MAG: hypothetical protein WBO17_16135 [Sphingorhabdus sp.]